MALRGLAGKRAIVTGAGGGIGSAIVTRLLDEGVHVLCVDRSAEALGSAPFADHPRAVLFESDVSSNSGASAYTAEAVRVFGGADLFVNNAAIFEAGTVAEMPIDAFDRVMAVNLRGAFLGLQAVLRLLQSQATGGSVVNISSIGALLAAASCGAYNASKAGLISLTRTAAKECGMHRIRVNAVCPGPTDTPMIRSAQQAGDPAEMAKLLPLGRLAHPSEIADLAIYLLSDESSFQTGGTYLVDGGKLL